jgi:hypothetical protein
LRGANHAIRATPRQTGATSGSRTQNTGAPISRSRIEPPPTPVISAKKAMVTKVWRSFAASSAPESANTAIPARSRMPRIAGRLGAGSGGIAGP